MLFLKIQIHKDERMKNFKLTKLIVSFSLFFLIQPLFSQIDISPSPLGPGIGEIQRELGIFFGLGASWQTGEIFASCDCPAFSGGGKSNYSFGLIYQQDIASNFSFGAKTSLWVLSNYASYNQKEPIELTSQSGEVFLVQILFGQRLNLDISYLTFEPFLAYRPFPFMYLRIGGRTALPLSSKILHTKGLLQKTVRLDNGEVIDLTLKSGNQSIELENGKLQSLVSPYFSLQPELGFNIHLGGNIFASIGFLQGIPLNKTATRGNNFKMYFWQILIDIRYAITMRSF